MPLNIVTKTAAPHHQSTNGLTENRWKNTCTRCQKMLLHARLDRRFFYTAILYAAMITNMTPLKGLEMEDSNGMIWPTMPYKMYYK
jgi:hypothetical protein